MGCCLWPSLIAGRIQKLRAPTAKASMLQEGSGHCSRWARENRAFPEARAEQGGEQVGPPDTSFQAGNKTGGSWKGHVLGRAPSLLEEHAVRLSEAGFGVVTGICPAPALGSGTQALISPP